MKNLTETSEKKLQFQTEDIAKHEAILTDEAIDFLVELHERFNRKRVALLEARNQQQILFDYLY